ncbi:MAG: hypothetical protein Tsb0020_23270 [Haliangiales bacterium]
MVLGVVSGCAQGESGADDADRADDAAEATEAISHTSELGPVRAVVTLTPAEPRLGDSLSLTLEVTAEPGVTVEMPSFGEALGRFQIEQFTPRQRVDADGTTIATQTYALQAPMSGRQRIPPLRVEFVDERAAAGAGATGGDDDDEVRELLTDEIAVEVESVLADGEVSDQLAPLRDPLAARRDTARLLLLFGPIGLAAGGCLIWLLISARRQAARRKARVSAFDRAIARLRVLEAGGLPSADQAGDWYVDLSSIVRRYLEDRYGLRAPELTTEEFLHEAQRAGVISSAHRNLLTTFLEHCDRVKFARYEPGDTESREALAHARRFLEETRALGSGGEAGRGSALEGVERAAGGAQASASERAAESAAEPVSEAESAAEPAVAPVGEADRAVDDDIDAGATGAAAAGDDRERAGDDDDADSDNDNEKEKAT